MKTRKTQINQRETLTAVFTVQRRVNTLMKRFVEPQLVAEMCLGVCTHYPQPKDFGKFD